ncbi:DUF1972 domain-containing protein [Cronobacter malonaticus]
MKKVSVIGIVGIPASYGGFESLVENLTRFSSEDIHYDVYCSSKQLPTKLHNHNGAELRYVPLKANGIQSILYDIVSILRTLRHKSNVMLVLGVSGAIAIPLFKIFSRSKVITNIDGLEWKREKWGRFARAFLKFSEALAVKYSDVIITDNQAISDYVAIEYGRKSEVIAYGGDHALTHENITDVKNEEPYFLTVCRIEPENNIHLILDSFAKSKKHIKFVGNWSSNEYGRELLRKYDNISNVELINPIYDINELYKLRMNCFGYIHGHSAGGTNPSLVEAMHFEKPIYAFDCKFNRFTTEDKAFYFDSSDSLIQLLNNSNLDTTANAVCMKEIAKRRYTWEIIARQYEHLY